ncbi:MAG: RNA-binding S4 domain-containing protein, partial [Gemmataceae bacterium]
MSERTVTLRGDHITLAQAIKVAGLADTGGSAKVAVREGT